ncbi:MAG TPA: hypothetical protein VFA33_25260 [Bryobacteraceae bacterium]|nr:hypothetical protein [Bryobacteraceae bacterium]
MESAIKELQETVIVMSGIQAHQARLLKEHTQWKEDHTLAMRYHDERTAELDRKLDRIADLILKGCGGNGGQ